MTDKEPLFESGYDVSLLHVWCRRCGVEVRDQRTHFLWHEGEYRLIGRSGSEGADGD